jgi:hypothetical protein
MWEKNFATNNQIYLVFCRHSLKLLPGYLYSIVQLCLQGEKEVLLVVRPPHQVVQGYSKKINKKFIKMYFPAVFKNVVRQKFLLSDKPK